VQVINSVRSETSPVCNSSSWRQLLYPKNINKENLSRWCLIIIAFASSILHPLFILYLSPKNYIEAYKAQVVKSVVPQVSLQNSNR
jgi:hypothetical protein